MTDRREPAAHPIRDLLAFWDALYQQHLGARYPFNGGRDSKLVKDLREFYSDEQLRTFMAAFFVIEDEFIATSGHSLAVFRGCLPKVIAFVNKPKSVPAKPWSPVPDAETTRKNDPYANMQWGKPA